MSEFRLVINTDNDAFQHIGEGRALAGLLRNLASELEGRFHRDAGTVRDVNGNTVGKWSLTDGEV